MPTLKSTARNLSSSAIFVMRVFVAKDCWIYTLVFWREFVFIKHLGQTLLYSTYDNYYYVLLGLQFECTHKGAQ